MSSLHLDEALGKAVKASQPSQGASKMLKRLVRAGKEMTASDRLKQKRFTLYGTQNPDPETKKRIDQYMERYYGV